MSQAPVAAPDVRVQVRGLSKRFPGTVALDNVDLDVRPSEIHALVGGNGSGKSTLIKILAGVYQGDRGELAVGDVVTAAEDASPEQARATGVHVVHQDLGVFPDMSVLENIALGYGYPTGPAARVRWRQLRTRTERLIERFEIPARPETPLRSLSYAARTQVAIARALQDEDESVGRGLLILDEPTSALPAHEVDLLTGTLRRYAARGQAILYVSHRLDEVLAIADRITVLRDGVKVGTFAAEEMDEERLIRAIVGRQVEQVFVPMPEVEGREVVFEARDLTAGPLRGVDLQVLRGEVLGIAGLLGSGRTELLRAIFGDLPLVSGTMRLDGKKLAPRRPADAMAAGVAYIPENRGADGAFSDLSVRRNAMMASVPEYWSGLHIADGRMARDAVRLIDDFVVKTPSDAVPIATLSGGNQQKVIVARWLRRRPKLLLLDEPTQGIDVAARAEIYGLVRQAVSQGATAILVASDFEELSLVSDRVVVLREGRIRGEIERPELTAERLTQLTYARQGAGR
jgi:ribose transport system ATP-binding protein